MPTTTPPNGGNTTARRYNSSPTADEGVAVPEGDHQGRQSNDVPWYMGESRTSRTSEFSNWRPGPADEDTEQGNGGDSDNDADVADEHHDAMVEVIQDRLERLALGEEDDEVLELADSAVLLHRGELDAARALGITIPGTPEDWVPPVRKIEKGEPAFETIDNPGKWSAYTFRPEFSGKPATGPYKRHSLPTGASPVPKGPDGKRCVNGWEFFYDGWTKGDDDATARSGATRENLFPESRKGCLDQRLLRKLGLTKRVIQDKDALFFYQLLLPMCDPRRSGIEGDPRKAFYCDVEMFSNLYFMCMGYGGAYGHAFEPVMLPELVRFDGVVVRDGVRGGSDGAVYRRWDAQGVSHDAQVINSMTLARWLQIKRVYKLCDNGRAKKRGEEGYNPAYKYDFIYEVLVHNVNALTKHAELDLCGDETTWGHGGYGEAGSGLVGRILGKPGVTKGGQIVLVSDVHRIRPRAFLHRHKLHVKPPGWTAMGPLEARRIMEQLGSMTLGEPPRRTRQVFREKPHTTWDNYFSGDKISDWAGQNGFGATMTCRRDRLPIRGDEVLHKKKTDSGKRPKAARFQQPITAVKTVEANGSSQKYTRVHCSFQSTSSCNISTVNALNGCNGYVRRRERGRMENKRLWGIEMNESRQLYLGSYSRIDSIDHLIKNTNMFYRSWKYWHSPMLHGKALTVVVAYDMYLECIEGGLDPLWKVNDERDRMDFHEFREKLSEQMLAYSPTSRIYPGDSMLRVSTKQTHAQRKQTPDSGRRGRGRPPAPGRAPDPTSAESVTTRAVAEGSYTAVSENVFEETKWGDGLDSRLCGDFTQLQHHLSQKGDTSKSGKNCAVCGKKAYTSCKLCNVALHHFPKTGENKEKMCYIEYHSDTFMGLARTDSAEKTKWTYPTSARKSTNRLHVRKLKRKFDEAAHAVDEGEYPDRAVI